MTSRCIMVLGIPRSGTSCVAGILHHLGVDMGEGHLQPADDNNLSGYWEDLRWQRINKAIVGNRYGHHEPLAIQTYHQDQYRKLAEQCNQAELWGMKDPRLCFTAQFIWPYLKDCRVISVHRDLDAATSSLRVHSEQSYKGKHRMDQEEARALQELWNEALMLRLTGFRGPRLAVPYDRLLLYPHGWVWRIGGFAYQDRAGLNVWNVNRAVEFVQPGLKHHG